MRITKHSSYILLLLLALIALLFIPFKVPHSVEAPARIVGLQEWTLTVGNNGELVSTLRSNLTGTSSSYLVSSVSGDGQTSFSLCESVLAGDLVMAGDTIGYLRSTETEQQLISLRGDLQVTQASLAADASGGKPAVIEEMRQELRLAEAEAEQQERITSRLAALRERELVSTEEYETATGDLQLLELKVDVARARLAAATSGAKAEDTTLIRTKIESIRAEIGALERELAAGVIVAPISGHWSRPAGCDTVITICDRSAYVAVMIVARNDFADLATADSSQVAWSSLDATGQARLLGSDREVHIMQGREVVYATARIDSAPVQLLPGSLAECSIVCRPTTLLELVGRFFGVRTG